MAKDYIDFARLEKLTRGDNSVALHDKVIKLFEEGGEVSAAILAFTGAANKSKSADQGDLKLNVLEECCDVLNIVMDIINNLGYSDQVVETMFDIKLSKWEAKLNKPKENWNL